MTTLAMGTLVASSAGLAALAFVASTASASTSAAWKRYGVINATVDAATVHEIAGSSAFPNFVTGAVDNYYSMAHTHVDNSPFAEGTSSPLDTGPIGQTVAAGNFAQPQYADARWPGKNSGKATFGNQGGPYAVADAASFKATATCTEASGASGGSSGSGKTAGLAAPKGFARRLRLALAAWKARWLVPLGLKIPTVRIPASAKGVPVPTVSVPSVTTPTVSTPVVNPGKTSTTGTSTSSTTSTGKTSTTSTTSGPSGSPGNALLGSSSAIMLDPKTGAVVSKGESSLGTIDIGGQIVIKGIDVSAMITNSGKKPTDKLAIDIGAASIGGVPVTIDQAGVHVSGQGSNLPYQQADDALNGALKQAGVQIFTVVPELKKSANQLTITATGVHVSFIQPVQQSGVPAQYVDHIIGEVFVDSLASPGVPIPKLKLTGSVSSVAGTGSTSGGTSAGSLSGGGSASSGYSSSSPTSGSTTGTSTPASSLLTTVENKPLWLLVAYLVWQALVIGTAASLWRWRLGGAS